MIIAGRTQLPIPQELNITPIMVYGLHAIYLSMQSWTDEAGLTDFYGLLLLRNEHRNDYSDDHRTR